MTDILVAGSLHWDTIVRAPRLPRSDETLMGTDVHHRFGGKGGNQALAAARMGARVAMAGATGDDADGGRLRAALTEAGVEIGQVQTATAPSGMSVAILEANGEYGAVVVSGANQAIDPSRIGIPDACQMVCLQNEVPAAVNLALAKAAGQAGAKVMLNAAPARALDGDMIERTDILVANRVEAAMLWPRLADALTDDARPFSGGRPPDLPGIDVVITLGGHGLIFVPRDGGPVRYPAHRVRMLSAHGAGDMFCGALAAALVRGAPVTEALEFAQAAAALLVSSRDPFRTSFGPDEVAALRSQSFRP
ncbi:MAG: PfkB family carbohydrate kinase [Pseudomonadota bacterium]